MTDKERASRTQEAKQTNTQKEKVLQYFQTHTATVRMCSQATGISAGAICSYKAQLIDDEKIIELDKKPCQLTGRKAWYYSAYPKNQS